MDFTLYWFMFPVAIGVATLAMLSGIGGAALFTPIFVLLFPILRTGRHISRREGAVLVALYVGYLSWTLAATRAA